MRNRALLSAIALCFIAAGCDSQKTAEPPKPKAAAAVVPVPPPAPQAPAASAGQDAKPVEPASPQVKQMAQAGTPATTPGTLCDHGAHCDVTVTVTDTTSGCDIAKDPKRLKVMRGHAETINWSMASGSTWVLDKIVFTTPNSPFTCHQAPPGTGDIHCQTPNTETQATEYPYVVHVKKDGKRCSTDPMIVNGADNTTP